MLSEKEHEIVDELSRLLLSIMVLARPPDGPSRFASVDSFQTLHASINFLRDFLYAASNGDLSKQVQLKGYIGGALKTLQANLKHMTWQTKMIASGDFSQRVEFMGEFSQSFNAMVMQLDQTLNDLFKKEKELRKANEDLHREIAIRQQTEKALRENEEALKLLAITDSLTGLYYRRHFNKLAETAISSADRYSRPLSIIIFDIDFFKRINDTFGHSTGDEVLKIVAVIATRVLRASDITARYGGEEFIVLLPETSAPEAAIVAEKLRVEIEGKTAQAKECPITVTASFGVSDYLGKWDSKQHEKVLSEIITHADQALYASKNAGRNRVTVYKGDEE